MSRGRRGSSSVIRRPIPAPSPGIAILAEAITQSHVSIFETVGDAAYAAFASPRDAVAAALRAQFNLHGMSWGDVGPLSVRMGLHTGEVERQGDHYFGVVPTAHPYRIS